MPNEEFYLSVEMYKRGLFDRIQFYDRYQETLFKFHPKQIKACEYYTDDITTSIGYGGAARGGKSALMSVLVLLDCFAYPETRYLMGRRDLTQFWGTTYKTLIRILNNFGFVDQQDYNHNHARSEITFFEPNSEIVIKNLELKPRDMDATAFGSLEITRALIDQSENIDLKIIQKVTERVGSHGVVRYNIKGKVLECFNPLKTHVHKRFWLMYKQGIDLDSIKFVRSLPTDNPAPEAKRWVAQKQKDFEDGIMPKVEYEKQIKGNFDYSDQDGVLISYDAITNYWNNRTIERTGEMYMTIDVARKGKDQTVFRIWDGWLCILRYALPKSLVTEVYEKANQFMERYKISNTKVIADEDGVGGGVVDMIGCMGFINNSRPINGENYEHLKTQCSYLMAKKISNGEAGELCSDPTVREIVSEEMEQVILRDIHKDTKIRLVQKEVIKKNIGRSPDDWDSIMMRYYFELTAGTDIWFG